VPRFGRGTPLQPRYGARPYQVAAGGATDTVGASAGGAAVAGIGAALVTSVGASSGAASASGVASYVVAAVGTSTSAASASGVGESAGVGSVGASAGGAAVAGIGAALALAVGASSGAASASGVAVGAALVTSVGASSGALRTVIGGRKPRRAEPTMQDRAREAGMLSPARQAAWIAAQTVRDVPPGMTQELATILFAAMEFVDE